MNNDLLQQTRDTSAQFGSNGWLLATQLIALLIAVLTISVTVYGLRHHRSNSQLPIWLLLAWLIPIVGPICAYYALRAQGQRSR